MAQKITFREGPGYKILVYVDGTLVFSHRDYSGAAEWAKVRYSLTDAQLYALYADYQESVE